MTSSPALFPAVTVTVVRDRKIRTALRTNQIAEFVTVPSWKKINYLYYMRILTLHYGMRKDIIYAFLRFFSGLRQGINASSRCCTERVKVSSRNFALRFQIV